MKMSSAEKNYKSAIHKARDIEKHEAAQESACKRSKMVAAGVIRSNKQYNGEHDFVDNAAQVDTTYIGAVGSIQCSLLAQLESAHSLEKFARDIVVMLYGEDRSGDKIVNTIPSVEEIAKVGKDDGAYGCLERGLSELYYSLNRIHSLLSKIRDGYTLSD